MFRLRRRSRCSSGKSSPTTATTCTCVKLLAASEKNVAAPPSTSFTSPNGVFTVSSAIDPTTTRLIAVSSRESGARASQGRALERVAAGARALARNPRDQHVQEITQARVVLVEHAHHGV